MSVTTHSAERFGKINFMHISRPAVLLSALLILVSVWSLATKGLNLGIDFTGGTLVEMGYEQPVSVDAVRAQVVAAGFEGAEVAYFGSNREILIRIAPREEQSSAQLSAQVLEAVQSAGERVEMRRVEFVGPKVGKELTEGGALALLYALIGILIYVGFRFEYRLSIGSVAALIHDVVITLGVFSLFYIPFDLTVIAALLAVIGYSLNDTIVVFDRIRENFIRLRNATPIDVANKSLNEMLSRTLMTSLTTLLVLVALLVLGGEIISGFALALTVGVAIGTYSSIYVAASLAIAMGVNKESLMPSEQEKDEDEAVSVTQAEIEQAFLQQQLAMMEEEQAKKNKK